MTQQALVRLRALCSEGAVWVVRIGTAVVVMAGAGCGTSPLAAPTDPRSGCGLGPVPIVTMGPEPCTTVAPQCPNPRPQNARTLIWVGTCPFEGRDGSCQPVQLPGCPVDFKIVAMSLAHPNPNIPRPCILAGDVHLDVRATPEGGATILWDALELDPATCKIVGPELSGEATLAGPCCSKGIDIYFPVGDFTFRMLIRTDWQR